MADNTVPSVDSGQKMSLARVSISIHGTADPTEEGEGGETEHQCGADVENKQGGCTVRLEAGEVPGTGVQPKTPDADGQSYYCSSCKRTQLHNVPQPTVSDGTETETPGGQTVDAVRVRHAYKSFGRRRKVVVMEDLNMTVNSGSM